MNGDHPFSWGGGNPVPIKGVGLRHCHTVARTRSVLSKQEAAF